MQGTLAAGAKSAAAFTWECTCGSFNVKKCASVELSIAERRELEEYHGIERTTTDTWIAAPSLLLCETCGEPFDIDQD